MPALIRRPKINVIAVIRADNGEAKDFIYILQIGELAMIPFKDVKELLYKLFEERMVKVQVTTVMLRLKEGGF